MFAIAKSLKSLAILTETELETERIVTRTNTTPTSIDNTPDPTVTPTITIISTHTSTAQKTSLPEGEYILFESGFPGALYALPVSGGDSIPITNIRPMFISSNGRYGSKGVYQGTVIVIDLFTGKMKLNYVPEECFGAVSFSPLGDWIASSCDKNMLLISLESDQTVNLTDWAPPSLIPEFDNPNWSPDGNRMVYEGQMGLLNPHTSDGLYIASLDCLPLFENCQIKTHGPFFSKGSFEFSAWSKDSLKLAVAKYPFDNIIYIIDTSTMIVSQQLELNQNYIRGLAWSPDGEFIAFGADDGLYIISISDMSTTRLFEVSGSSTVLVRGWQYYEHLELIDLED